MKIAKLQAIHYAAVELASATSVFSHTGERSGISSGSVSQGPELDRVDRAVQSLRSLLLKKTRPRSVV